MKTYFRIAVLALAGMGAASGQPPPTFVAPTPATPQPAPTPAAAQPAPTPQAAPGANPSPPPSAPAKLGAAELEKLAAPIALHPDPLIAVILPASVYPLEIVQAARFVKDTNNLSKVDDQPWDENVKAVARFPDLIAKMDADLSWTVALGQAFLDQPKELMDMIQSLRTKAQKAGTLQSTPQQVVTVTNVVVVQTNFSQVVTVTNQIIQVQPSDPQVVYVPSYPPTVYYPPPTYVYNPYAPLVTFGVGMAWGAILANNCDWHGGDVDIDIDRTVNRGDRTVNRGDRPAPQSGNRAATTGAGQNRQKWQPDQSRLRSSGAPGSAQNRQARGWGGASTQPAQRAGAGPSQRASATAGGARPAQQPAYNRSQRPTTGAQPARSPSAARPSTSATRPTQSSSASRRGGYSSGAFSGMSSGSSARNYSGRGAASRGGGGMRGGGGRRR